MRDSNSGITDRPTRRKRIFLLSVALLAIAALPACAAPQIVPLDALGNIEKLRLGDDLRVAIRDGSPNTVYELRLVDSANQLIASRNFTTDNVGTAQSALLWQRTGVVGCDTGVTPNYSAWLFERFEDAEARDGETLQLVLRKAINSVQVAQLALPVYADETTPRFYLSDADACPRFEHEAETGRWVSGVHLAPFAGEERRLWILDPSLGATATLADLRPGYPDGQTFTVPTNWQGVALVAVADLPVFYHFWASIEAPPAEPPASEIERPSCLTYPTRSIPSGTQTTPVPVCPPCIGN